jgi:hypothetical protein
MQLNGCIFTKESVVLGDWSTLFRLLKANLVPMITERH